jgi:hypothetical protein
MNHWIDVYREKTDEELLRIATSPDLLPEAKNALQEALASRKLGEAEIAEYADDVKSDDPDLSNPQELRAWRSGQLKAMANLLGWLPVWGISVPLVDTYSNEQSAALFLAVSMVPVLVFVWGARVLLYPDAHRRRPFAVVCGAVAACVQLTLVPYSARLALLDFASHPSWTALIAAGTVVVITYFWFAYRYLRASRSVT